MGPGQGDEDDDDGQDHEAADEVQLEVTGVIAVVREFTEYTSLPEALEILRNNTQVSRRRESVPLGLSSGRVLYRDIVSEYDIPPRDNSHMDGFAVLSSDLSLASPSSPVKLRKVDGPALGDVPRRPLKKGEAHTVLTGGFIPTGADTVVQAEMVEADSDFVTFSNAAEKGEFVYSRGMDVKKGETVLGAGRILRGTDLVLIGSLHMEMVPVYSRPRVAIIPTGNELSEKIGATEPGKVAETHSFLLSRLIEGAGAIPVQMPIARDDADEIRQSIKVALRAADIVLTVAGSSVSETDVTDDAINAFGKPGVLVHGMKVTRGRVMGFGVAKGKAVIILPGPIQGALNAFTVMGYPLIRAFLGRGFESPPSIPAVMAKDWDAGKRFRTFTKVVYVKTNTDGPAVTVEPSYGETENVTFLTRNDGYLILGEDTVVLKKGDPVRVHLLPGLSNLS
ncbi:MAG: molybdopterin molybdotransferase MoeA [Thaumarchaeota archaeon]|nr:molybdopterin molybdotransferase MoeA [Nitrososphaerota archaeon]